MKTYVEVEEWIVKYDPDIVKDKIKAYLVKKNGQGKLI